MTEPAHDYQAMLAAMEPDEVPPMGDAADALLHELVHGLPAPTIKRIARRLEADRKRFSRTSTPGHLVWYPLKVAVCALFQRLTTR